MPDDKLSPGVIKTLLEGVHGFPDCTPSIAEWLDIELGDVGPSTYSDCFSRLASYAASEGLLLRTSVTMSLVDYEED